MLTAGQVAGLIVAVFWAILVCFLVMVLVKVARLLTETTKLVSELTDRVVPLLEDASDTVAETNRRLIALESITTDVKQVSDQLAKFSGIAGTLVTGPLIKMSALGHGVRRAVESRRGSGRRTALERRQ
jgi:uncharacterized protein YoxC